MKSLVSHSTHSIRQGAPDVVAPALLAGGGVLGWAVHKEPSVGAIEGVEVAEALLCIKASLF